MSSTTKPSKRRPRDFAALLLASLGSCLASSTARPEPVDSEKVGIQIACPNAKWQAAKGWKSALQSSAQVRNASTRDIWFLGYSRPEPVLRVTGLRDGEWEFLPSNVASSGIDWKWHRLAPGAEVTGNIEAFADPQPIRILFTASFEPPVGDHVESFEVLGPRTELEKAPAQ